MYYRIIKLSNFQVEDIQNKLNEYEKNILLRYKEIGSYENREDGFSEYFFKKTKNRKCN